MYNKQLIIGNLGKDPETRVFEDGSKEVKFTVAFSKKGYTLNTGKVVPDHTEWFNCVARGGKAEFVSQYLRKGDKVFCEGETYTSEYTDAQGFTKRRTEVRCTEVIGLSQKQQATDNGQQKQGNAPETQRAQQAVPQQPQPSFGTQEVLPF